ncbi:MAG: hypothetical protein WC881_02925 [Elusimicrobiota bacterium]|jgi:endoglucanase
MSDQTLDILRVLTSVPTAPFREQAVTRRVPGWARKALGRKVRVRRLRSGLILEYLGAGPGPALALAAHLDHPGFHLDKVTARGCRATLQGGHPRELLEGCKVEAFPALPRGNRPAAIGVLGPAPASGDAFSVTWTLAPQRGQKLDFAILALTPCAVEKGWVRSRSIDDLMGAAIALEALRRAIRSRIRVNLKVLLHRAEEVGFVGALDFARQGYASPDDSIISIEASRQLPGARPGRGPVIRLGDKACMFDPNLIALLDAAAARLKARRIRTQRRRLIGGTCEATAYLAHGYETAGVALPLVNYHNGIGAKKVAPEMIRLSDALGCVALLLEAAGLFPAAALRGRLRQRLAGIHRRYDRCL